VEHGCDQELDVAVVETGESVPEVDGYPVSQARCDPQHALLAAFSELNMIMNIQLLIKTIFRTHAGWL
jgi:hypothetical protein